MKQIHYYILFYICLIAISPPRYIRVLPTVPVYPENTREIQEVREFVNRRTNADIQLFRDTDDSVSSQFAPLVKESVSDLDAIATSLKVFVVVYGFKYLFNRARPKQIDPSLPTLVSKTADTPAYPSGHALQSYYLAKVLSQRYPDKTEIFERIAEDCANARVYAGLHYPSDNRMSRWIVDHLL